jgi:aryl-alcohol dehydrogenase-like predicted oxidoreductase
LTRIHYLIDLCRYSEENIQHVCKLAEMLKAIGEKHGATAAQVTLAWLLEQGEDIIPLPGTRRIKVFSLHFACPLNDNQLKST